MLPDPLVAPPLPWPPLPPPSSPYRALPKFYLLCPAALRAPPGLPCSSAFADSSIKDITKSTLDENTLPLYRGVPRERRAKTRYVCAKVGVVHRHCRPDIRAPATPPKRGPRTHLPCLSLFLSLVRLRSGLGRAHDSDALFSYEIDDKE